MKNTQLQLEAVSFKRGGFASIDAGNQINAILLSFTSTQELPEALLRNKQKDKVPKFQNGLQTTRIVVLTMNDILLPHPPSNSRQAMGVYLFRGRKLCSKSNNQL